MLDKADMRQIVTEESACLHGFPRHGLNATHSGMNKFDGPESLNFILVKESILRFVTQAPSVLSRHKSGTLLQAVGGRIGRSNNQ